MISHWPLTSIVLSTLKVRLFSVCFPEPMKELVGVVCIARGVVKVPASRTIVLSRRLGRMSWLDDKCINYICN